MKIFMSLAAACLGVTFFLAAQPPAASSSTTSILAPVADRDVTTFKLFKDKDPTGIGSVKVLIRKLDAKEQKYSVDISVGKRRMEKKDIYAGEPILFYADND